MTCCNRWHFLKAVWRLWWGPHWRRCLVGTIDDTVCDMDPTKSPSKALVVEAIVDHEGCEFVSAHDAEDDEPTPVQMTTTGGIGTTHFLVLPSKYWKN